MSSLCRPTSTTSSFFFYCYGDHRDLHSFPTRRSSDLRRPGRRRQHPLCAAPFRGHRRRSEEHTSELQSRVDLVCRLLPEKKNIIKDEFLLGQDIRNVDHEFRAGFGFSSFVLKGSATPDIYTLSLHDALPI